MPSSSSPLPPSCAQSTQSPLTQCLPVLPVCSSALPVCPVLPSEAPSSHPSAPSLSQFAPVSQFPPPVCPDVLPSLSQSPPVSSCAQPTMPQCPQSVPVPPAQPQYTRTARGRRHSPRRRSGPRLSIPPLPVPEVAAPAASSRWFITAEGGVVTSASPSHVTENPRVTSRGLRKCAGETGRGGRIGVRHRGPYRAAGGQRGPVPGVIEPGGGRLEGPGTGEPESGG